MAADYTFDASRLLTWETIRARLAAIEADVPAEERAANPPSLAMVVSCGSFNPVTIAHVQMLDSAKSFLDGKPYEVAGAPQVAGLATPPRTTIAVGGFISPVNDKYGKADLAPFASRRSVCELAFRDNDWVTVEAWEGTRDAYQPTFKVLTYLRNTVREHYVSTAATEEEKALVAKIELYFLCGGDLFGTFYRSGVWELDLLERIFTEFRLLVVSREGVADPLDTIAAHTEPLTHPSSPGTALDLRLFRHRVLVIRIPPNTISSTEVRAQLRAEGGSVSGLISEETASYLREHKVY